MGGGGSSNIEMRGEEGGWRIVAEQLRNAWRKRKAAEGGGRSRGVHLEAPEGRVNFGGGLGGVAAATSKCLEKEERWEDATERRTSKPLILG